jgi:hypothetical protein
MQKELAVGNNVKLSTADGKFKANAVIRAAQASSDQIWRMVVEFIGVDWKRNWIFPRDAKECIYEDLLYCSKETFNMLQNVEAIMQAGNLPDPTLLSNVKRSVDDLRKVVFTAQRSMDQDN